MNPWTGLVDRHAARKTGPCRKSPRFEVAARLLEDGPLSLAQLREITGWTTNQAAYVLFYMAKDGVVNRTGKHHYTAYELAR
jgi:predicted Rossmann fold nucleotide-binding protein DprA/Smf involved in DNA uptake